MLCKIDNLEKNLDKKINKEVIRKLDNEVIKKIDKEVIKKLDNEVIKKIDKEVIRKLDNEVIKKIDKEVIKKLDNEVIKKIDKEVIKKLDNEVIKKIEKEIIEKLDKKIIKQLGKLDYIINKLSIENNIVELKDVRFYVPNAPRDWIQNIQLSNFSFYELEILQDLSNYLSNESIIIDVGANVGNHTVYWGKISNVRKIYSFEPIRTTFQILKRNIEINNLSNKVKAYNIGLSNKISKAIITNYFPKNLGKTSLNEAESGNIELNKLDNFDEIMNERKIDFIKIDVEHFEKNVLLGGQKFFNKYKPIVFIESFQNENEFDFVNDYFKKLNYNNPISYENNNYLFLITK